MEIVVNRCYGGFELSDEAFEEYLKRKNIEYIVEIDKYDRKKYYTKSGKLLWDGQIPRYDKVLIEIVKEMGEKSFGKFAELEIVEIPDEVDWYIDDYDGMETVEEKHRSW